MKKLVNIYTDGACAGNQSEENIGGWGCVLEFAGVEKELVTIGARSKIEVWAREVWEDPLNDSKMETEDFGEALREYGF